MSRDKTRDSPWESWWRVGGFPNDPLGSPPFAGCIGKFLGYEYVEEAEKELVALQLYPDGRIEHFYPHALFPAEKPDGAGTMPVAYRPGTQLEMF